MKKDGYSIFIYFDRLDLKRFKIASAENREAGNL